MARRIAFERKQRDWTTEALAKRMTDAGCPINQSAIWKIENGEPRRRISFDEAAGFAKVFEMPLEELAVAPEIAANDTVRALVQEHQRLSAEMVRQDIAMGRIADQVRAILAEFPDSERVLEELLPADDQLVDWYAGRPR